MGTHPELKSKVLTPDVLVQPHMASLEMVFYPTAKLARLFQRNTRRCVRRRAWLVEPQVARRVQRHPHPDEERKSYRRVRRLPRRLHDS